MDYLNDSPGTLYRKLLPAAVGSMLAATVTSFVDVLILSYYLGPNMLAVVELCMPVYMLLNALSLLISSGGSTLMAQFIGEGNRRKADACYTLSCFLMVATGAALMLGGSLFTTGIVRLLGANETLLAPTTEYAHVLFLFMIPIMLYQFFMYFVRVDGEPNRCLAGSVVCGVVNLVLDVLFVGPLGWGVKGAALATCLAYTIGMMVTASHLFSKKNTLKLVWDGMFATTLPILKTGLPLSFTDFGMSLTTSVFNNRIMQIGGESHVAAYAVITQLSMTAMAFYDGTGQAAQPIIAANYGAKKKDRIQETVKRGIRYEILLTAVCMLLYIVAAKQICALFSIHEGELLDVASSAVRIYALAIPFTGINVFIMYIFQSQERTVIATVISLVGNCVMMLLILFVLTAIFGVDGIWFTWLVAQGLAMILNLCLHHAFAAKEKI